MLRLVFSFITRHDSEYTERKELGVIGCSTIQEGLMELKMIYPDCHRVDVTICYLQSLERQ